jgi:hypothetical protein
MYEDFILRLGVILLRRTGEVCSQVPGTAVAQTILCALERYIRLQSHRMALRHVAEACLSLCL